MAVPVFLSVDKSNRQRGMVYLNEYMSMQSPLKLNAA